MHAVQYMFVLPIHMCMYHVELNDSAFQNTTEMIQLPVDMYVALDCSASDTLVCVVIFSFVAYEVPSIIIL